MKVCIVIPVHNEAHAMSGLIEAIGKKHLDVVVIDDGSTDGCGDMAKSKGAFLIRHDEKKGKGASLEDGFYYCLRHGYDGVIAMDGDGQHAVEDLDTFLRAAEAHPRDIITGNRMMDTKGMPGLRLFTNRFMSWLISRICKQDIPDTQCGFRYISRNILDEIRLTCHDFEIETEVLIKASRKGYKIYSIPIQTIYRNEASKINPFKDTIRFFVYILKELRSNPPTRPSIDA